MKIKFRCPDPDCNSHKRPGLGLSWVEEVLIEVCQSSVVSDIESITDTIAEVEYGYCSYDGGQVDRYICGYCGFVLSGGPFNSITEAYELFEWLKERGMLSA